MGNRVTNALDKWGLNPRKLSRKRSTRKAPSAASLRQTVDVHIYEHVAAEPEYAKVNKKKKTDSDGLHYADVQVLQSESMSNQRAVPPNNSITEYATIDFLRGLKPNMSPKPADILIPPGELQRPMAKSQRIKSVSSHRAVMV